MDGDKLGMHADAFKYNSALSSMLLDVVATTSKTQDPYMGDEGCWFMACAAQTGASA
jgi:hypothetical protein